MLKKVLLLFFLGIAIFFLIFIKSNTWQADQRRIIRNDVEYIETQHSFHWDRFFNYLKGIPQGIIARVSQK